MFSVLALAGAAAAYNATTTVGSTAYVTIPCSSGQTVTYGSLTYTATQATTLTVEDCSCTASAPGVASATGSSSPSAVLANGAAAGPAAAAAGVAAAVAYLL